MNSLITSRINLYKTPSLISPKPACEGRRTIIQRIKNVAVFTFQWFQTLWNRSFHFAKEWSFVTDRSLIRDVKAHEKVSSGLNDAEVIAIGKELLQRNPRDIELHQCIERLQYRLDRFTQTPYQLAQRESELQNVIEASVKMQNSSKHENQKMAHQIQVLENALNKSTLNQTTMERELNRLLSHAHQMQVLENALNMSTLNQTTMEQEINRVNSHAHHLSQVNQTQAIELQKIPQLEQQISELKNNLSSVNSEKSVLEKKNHSLRKAITTTKNESKPPLHPIELINHNENEIKAIETHIAKIQRDNDQAIEILKVRKKRYDDRGDLDKGLDMANEIRYAENSVAYKKYPHELRKQKLEEEVKMQISKLTYEEHVFKLNNDIQIEDLRRKAGIIQYRFEKELLEEKLGQSEESDKQITGQIEKITKAFNLNNYGHDIEIKKLKKSLSELTK